MKKEDCVLPRVCRQRHRSAPRWVGLATEGDVGADDVPTAPCLVWLLEVEGILRTKQN